MKKVALLDDELSARTRLKSLLSGFSQLELSISTADPYELLDYVKEHCLDIIFLDMNMPKLDGLGFLQQLQTLDNCIQVVVISGYADFEYAKGAIQYGVKAYMLKHEITEESLQKVLQDLHLDTCEENDPGAQTSKILQILKEEEGNRQQLLLAECCAFPEKQLISLMIAPLNVKASIMEKERYKIKSMEVLADFLKETLSDRISLLTAVTDRGVLLAVLSFAEFASKSEIHHYIEGLVLKLRNTTQRLLDLQLFVKVGRLTNDLNQSTKIFRLEEEFDNQLFYVTSERGIVYEDRQEVFYDALFDDKKECLRQLEVDLFFSARFYHPAQFEDSVKQFFQFLRNQHLSRAAIDRILGETWRGLLAEWSQYAPWADETNLNDSSLGSDFSTIQQMEQKATEKIHEAFESYGKSYLSACDSLVQQSVLFIHQCFKQEISLKECAENLHVNYSYLSRIFNEQWPMSFVKYLNHVRIEYAKKLLAFSNKTIAEVAEAAGFASYNYFFRIFKEQTGTSPNEYCKH